MGACVLAPADAELEAWLADLLSPVPIRCEPPVPGPEGTGVGLYLMGLAPSPPLRGHERPPFQAVLRYLVTAWDASAAGAHGLLDQVLVAALERSDLEVELDGLDSATWLALGVRPQAAFVLAVPVRHLRPTTAAPQVRYPTIVESQPIGPLRGVLLGPGDQPVAGAEVVLPSPRRRCRTDAAGRFVLAGVPLGAPHHSLEVHARGRTFAALTPDADPAGTVVIRIDLLED